MRLPAPVDALDARLLHAAARLRRPGLTRVVAGYSRLCDWGYGWVAAGGALAIAVRRPRPALETAAAVWGTLVANGLLKRVIRRERPADASLPAALIDAPSSKSFPSSHAAMSAAAAVTLCRLSPRLAPAVVPAAAGMALTRVYLAVHYPSDIAAGALVGTAGGLVLAAATDRLDRAVGADG